MNAWGVVFNTLLFRLIKFLLIFLSVSILAITFEKRLGKERLLGVTIGAALIISGAVYDLIKFVDWPYYQFTFQGLPHSAIIVRYVFSILWRIVLIVAGIGLLGLNDQARKAIIILAWAQIVTIFWKHPLFVFQHLALKMQEQAMPGTTHLLYPWQPWVLFVFFSIFDIFISSLIIYYFNRPSTKENFA